jgi:hypothetical protein
MKNLVVQIASSGLIAAAALLAGCATGPKLDYTDYAGEPVKSFYMNTFDGWNVVSKDQVVIWSGLNKAYLVSVRGYCPDLQYANTIGVTSTASTVDRFEKIVVGRDQCMISEIRPLDTKQMKEDRKLMKEQRESAES